MSESRADPERLAALLDGRLQGAEREQLIRELASSPEDYEDLLESALLLRDLHDEQPAVIPIHVPPSRRISVWQWALRAAAVVAIVGAAAVLMLRFLRDDSPIRYAGALPLDVAARATFDRSPWAFARNADPVMTPTGRSVRIGARLTDLALAIRANDPAATVIATQIAALLSDRQGGEAAAGVFRQLAAAPSMTALQEAVATLEPLPDIRLIELGAWVQAARTELAGGARELNNPDDGVRVIDGALSAFEPQSDPARAASAVRALLENNAAATEMAAALATLLAEAAR